LAGQRHSWRTAIFVGVAAVSASLMLSSLPAAATVPSLPPGSPAVESAPSSLVGLDPQLPQSVIAASAAPGSHWTPQPAIYGTASINNIAVPGAGGITIRVNEIYPTLADGKAAPGPFPVLLTMTPYGKGQGGSSAPGSASTPSSGNPTGGADDYLVERGYIDVVMDIRGTGDSGGQWGLFDPIQKQDAIRAVDWCAHLPHSNGKVGTYGPSYLGIDQLLLAGAIGPHSPLKAIFPMVAANDIYRDTAFVCQRCREGVRLLTPPIRTDVPTIRQAGGPASGRSGSSVRGLPGWLGRCGAALRSLAPPPLAPVVSPHRRDVCADRRYSGGDRKVPLSAIGRRDAVRTVRRCDGTRAGGETRCGRCGVAVVGCSVTGP